MPNISISLAGIHKLVSNLNIAKAAGPDDIKPVVLKNLNDQIAPILKVIFQQSLNSGLEEGCCHSLKRMTKVTLLTRPIALPCISCKLMEHIVASNLTKHLDRHNTL